MSNSREYQPGHRWNPLKWIHQHRMKPSLIYISESFHIFPCNMTVKTLQPSFSHWILPQFEFVGVYLPYFPDKHTYPLINEVGVIRDLMGSHWIYSQQMKLCSHGLSDVPHWNIVEPPINHHLKILKIFSMFRPKYHIKFISISYIPIKLPWNHPKIPIKFPWKHCDACEIPFHLPSGNLT